MFSFLRKIFTTNKKVNFNKLIKEIDNIDLEKINTTDSYWFVDYVPPSFFRENKEYLDQKFKKLSNHK